ncbi:MAG: hypothetical protein IKP58_07370 [Victivallales bacterium]|nr:hypothetical protein [Victivallales bacterium]
MYIKQDEDRKNHADRENNEEENLGFRSLKEILGDDKIVEEICVKDIPNNGKKIDFRLSERGVRKLYDEGIRLAKRAGCPDSLADAYARCLIDEYLKGYVKGYIESRYGIKLED